MVRKTQEGFPRHYRIVRGSEFRAVYDGGLKLYSERFGLFAKANTLEHHRLGITVSRKIGGAVIRNRVKRLFREVFRRSAAEIPSHFDLVINAKRGTARAGYAELREEFLTTVARIDRRQDGGASC